MKPWQPNTTFIKFIHRYEIERTENASKEQLLEIHKTAITKIKDFVLPIIEELDALNKQKCEALTAAQENEITELRKSAEDAQAKEQETADKNTALEKEKKAALEQNAKDKEQITALQHDLDLANTAKEAAEKNASDLKELLEKANKDAREQIEKSKKEYEAELNNLGKQVLKDKEDCKEQIKTAKTECADRIKEIQDATAKTVAEATEKAHYAEGESATLKNQLVVAQKNLEKAQQQSAKDKEDFLKTLNELKEIPDTEKRFAFLENAIKEIQAKQTDQDKAAAPKKPVKKTAAKAAPNE